MAMTATPSGIGELLRSWRARRRFSQLELALQTGVSQRHLSFIEVGRARPSRELVLQLATELDVPLRERNALLLASGFAPVYPETPVDSDGFQTVREAVRTLLRSHEPFPATVVDRGWNLVWANRPAWKIFTAGVARALLRPPVNVIRVALHPDGLMPRIVNQREYATYLITRLRREVAIAHDPRTVSLYEEVQSYPTIDRIPTEIALPTPGSASGDTSGDALFAPLRLRVADGGDLALFSMIATFGTAIDITLAELSIESYFPADKVSAATLSTMSS